MRPSGNLSDTFNRLIETCEEAEARFQEAAAVIEDQALARLLHIYSQQRTRFAGELRQCVASPRQVRACSGNAEERTGSNREDALNRCLSVEKETLDRYRDALGGGISLKARFLVAAQYALMQKAHERIRALFEMPAPPATIPATVERRTL